MRVALGVLAFLILTGQAGATPPASCAKRFVGHWSWTSASGIHVNNDYSADGYVNCTANSYCSHSLTWTCEGNKFILDNHISLTTLTLHPDGKTMTGMGGYPPNLQTAVRIGTGSSSPDGSDSKALALLASGKRIEQAARQSMGESRPDLAAIEALIGHAEDAYKEAADLFAKASDTPHQQEADKRAASMRALEAKVESSAKVAKVEKKATSKTVTAGDRPSAVECRTMAIRIESAKEAGGNWKIMQKLYDAKCN